MTSRFLRVAVADSTGLSRPTIYRQVKACLFPAWYCYGLPGGPVCWIESEVDEWKVDPAGWGILRGIPQVAFPVNAVRPTT